MNPQTLKSIYHQRHNLRLEVILSIVPILVTQGTFTCSKQKIETLEKGVKYVQSSQQKQQNDINDVAI